MLKKIISSQLRVFIVLSFMAFIGLVSATKLPVSLFPNTTKPTVHVNLIYGGLSSRDFIRQFGANFESELQAISNTGLKVNDVTVEYDSSSVWYHVHFDWGVPNKAAINEVKIVANGLKSRLPQDAADSMIVKTWAANSGFLAISFLAKKGR